MQPSPLACRSRPKPRQGTNLQDSTSRAVHRFDQLVGFSSCRHAHHGNDRLESGRGGQCGLASAALWCV